MELPQPEVGLVISYSYLWSVVLVVQHPEGRAPVVTLAPITHSPHRNPDAAMEIPHAVKRHLGLDDQSSWIVLDDFNVCTWPGYDLRRVPGQKDRYHYGVLPPKLFDSIIRKFSALRSQAQVARTSRDGEKLP